MDDISNDFWTPRACGDTVFVADTHNGVFMVDTADKRNLKIIGNLRLPSVRHWSATHGKQIETGDCAASLVLGDDVVYIAGQKTGLHLIKVPGKSRYEEPEVAALTVLPPKLEPEIPGLKRFDIGGNIRRVTTHGDLAYAACSHDGIRLLELSENGVTPLRQWKKQCSYDVKVKDGKLYSAEDDGLVIYRIKKDGDLHELGRYMPKSGTIQIVHLTVDGRFAVCTGGAPAVEFIDVTDPAKPTSAFRKSQRGIQYSDTLPQHDLGGRILACWHSHGQTWYDVSGEKPKLLEDQRDNGIANQLSGFTVYKNAFLIPGGKNNLFLLDPADCGAAGLEKPIHVEGPRLIGIPSWDGKNMVVFSCRRNGSVLACIEIEAGKWEYLPDRSYDISAGTPGRVVFWKDRMLIPGGHLGLFMENRK